MEPLDDRVNTAEAEFCRRQFVIMSVAFGINHATVTTPIIYASSVLTNQAGQASDAVIYGSCLLTSLFLSTLVFGLVGSKKGLAASMFSYAVYAFLFAMATNRCKSYSTNHTCEQGDPLQMPLALLGAGVGGMGAGVLWTCQGAVFATACQRIADAENRDRGAVSTDLSGRFALIFLCLECFTRLLSSVLVHELDDTSMFFSFAVVAMLSAFAYMVLGRELQPSRSKGTLCGKLMDAIRLWDDPTIWLLQFTNIAFGFSASWMSGYVARNILSTALHSTKFVGLAGAILSGVASILSWLFGRMARKTGKGVVLVIGSVTFLAIGILSKCVGHPSEWGWGVLGFYILGGVTRAVYESTNKAIFVDFFPGAKIPGAFANVFVFGTGASTVAFVFGASSLDYPEVYSFLAFSALIMPGYMLSHAIHKRRSSLMMISGVQLSGLSL